MSFYKCEKVAQEFANPPERLYFAWVEGHPQMEIERFVNFNRRGIRILISFIRSYRITVSEGRRRSSPMRGLNLMNATFLLQ
jgi:hypothetical protein